MRLLILVLELQIDQLGAFIAKLAAGGKLEMLSVIHNFMLAFA